MSKYLDIAGRALETMAEQPYCPSEPTKPSATVYEINELNEISPSDIVHGIPIADLELEAGADWPSIAENPVALSAWADLRHAIQLRDRGQIPEHWTKPFDCPRCGTVPVEPSWPVHVDHCPWCHNRLQGKPMPKGFEDG